MSDEYPHEEPLPENVRLHPMRACMDIPVVDLLRAAYKRDLASITITGIQKDGTKYLASSASDPQEIMFMLNRGLHEMNLICDEIDADTRMGNPPPEGEVS